MHALVFVKRGEQFICIKFARVDFLETTEHWDGRFEVQIQGFASAEFIEEPEAMKEHKELPHERVN